MTLPGFTPHADCAATGAGVAEAGVNAGLCCDGRLPKGVKRDFGKEGCGEAFWRYRAAKSFVPPNKGAEAREAVDREPARSM